MSDRDGSATPLPSGIVVACELACRYSTVRQCHRYINRSRWSRDGGVTTSERYVLQQRRDTQLAVSEPDPNALKLLQMFHASCDEPVHGTGTASLGLAVEATEFPLYVPYGIDLSEMSDGDDNTTTLPPGLVVAFELACRWPMDRQRHCNINRSRWSRNDVRAVRTTTTASGHSVGTK